MAKKINYSYRSSVTGRYVTAGYAKRYPHLTVRHKKKPRPEARG